MSPRVPVNTGGVQPLSPGAIAVGMAAGFGVVSVVGSIVTTHFVPGGFAKTAVRSAWDLALSSSVGAVWGGALALGSWLLARSRLSRSDVAPFALHASAAIGIAKLSLGEAIAHQAAVAMNGRFAKAFDVLMLLGTGIGIALAHTLGVLSTRRRFLAVALVTLAAVGAAVDATLLRDDFFESHCVGAWAAASALGGVLARWLERLFETRPRARKAAQALCLLTLVTLALPPSNRSRLLVFQNPAAVGAWTHAATVWRLPSSQAVGPSIIDAEWADGRAGHAPIPPSEARLVDGAPLVVFVTIDAVRADLLLDDANDARWPNLARLKREGAWFAHARAPGSQTAVSLTTVFSGRYFSELCWSKHGTGATRFDYAADDPSPRVPAILQDHGVSTVKIGAVRFLANEFGVASGFADEVMLVDDRRHAFANEVVEPLLTRLRKAGPEPAFYFAHLMEPHAPYDRGARTDGPLIERYEAEITVADEALGRIMRALASPKIAERAILVVSSDHGEAFGEHGTFEHTKTLYEELIRVPLLVRAPHVIPRRIDEPVSLVDLGPTLLDTFGVETPGAFMGQSLVPLLTGRGEPLRRPIISEGRLRRSLVTGGVKVIADLRRKTVEGFDLESDPKELRNLYDVDPDRVTPGLSALSRLFDRSRCPWPGYAPVYKP